MASIIQQPAVHLRDDSHRPPWYVVFAFVIPLLVNVVQMHFPNSSPYDTHPANMWTFMFALLTYCIALGYYVKSWLTGSGSFRNICDQVGYVSGSLACTALISVVVPPPLELSVFAIWMVASTMFIDVARYRIWEVARKLYHSARDALSQVSNIWKLIMGVVKNVGHNHCTDIESV